MAVSTVSSLNGLFNAIFEDAIFVAREVNLMAGLVTNYTANTMANRRLGIYPKLNATEVTEGVDFTLATEWTKTDQMTITPTTKMVQVIITDERLMTDPDDARRDASTEMGAAIGTRIDTDLVGLFSGFSARKGAAGTTLTISNCAAAVAVLRNNNVPNPIWFVLHPYHWHDVWVELGQPAANQAFLGDTANEAMRSYYVGTFLNAQWFVDANISVNADDDAYSAVFHREALALDTRTPPTMEVERDASLRAWELNMIVRYGVAERRDNFGVGLIADATEPT
jgi:hypothetical protein